MNDLNKHVKSIALANGGDLVGIVKTSEMPEHAESIVRILPAARALVVVASRHSLAAIRSANKQVAQFDTIHAYNECARSAHTVSRALESKGFAAAAVPAFIPIMKGLMGKQEPEIDRIIEGFELRELWQTFMTGNYYYCFECQSQCPATLFPHEV